MAQVFISYRRNDSQTVAGRLRDSLARHIGKKAIFRDKTNIKGGAKWMASIKQELTEGTIVLALIGANWVTNDKGQRRLEEPEDPNRIELELAFARDAIVVPLLIDETTNAREVPVA